MSEPGDAMLPEPPVASAPPAFAAVPDASMGPQPPAEDDCGSDGRTVRRAALRELSAMIGVEVFY